MHSKQSGYIHNRPVKQGLYDPRFEKDSCGVGFVAHIKGERSHQIVQDAFKSLFKLSHRGGLGCEANTGDGAGMLTALPHEFFTKVSSRDLKIELPSMGRYGVGMVFLPTDPQERETCKQAVNKIIQEQGQKLLGWRDVPQDTDGADVGPTARALEPAIEQVFIAGADGLDQNLLER